MKSIGELYFDSSFFRDEESKTIGQPLIGPNIETLVKNRRGAKGHLTPVGREILEKISSQVSETLGGIKIKVVWDRHCGCSMCPCSPGYRIKGDISFRSTDKTRFSIFVNEDGKVDFSKPQSSWELGYTEVNKLTETFGIVE